MVVKSQTRAYRLGRRAESMRQTRRRIVRTALRLFEQNGFHDVSLEELAIDARVSRATIYKHFDSKVDLLRAMQEELLGIGGGDRIRRARLHPDPRTALRGFLRENCRMFAVLRPGLRVARAAAWTDKQAARLASEFYYGERRKAVAHLVDRLNREHGLARGWTRRKAIQSLMALTNFEPFDSLTTEERLSPEAAAGVLYGLACAMLAPRPTRGAQ